MNRYDVLALRWIGVTVGLTFPVLASAVVAALTESPAAEWTCVGLVGCFLTSSLVVAVNLSRADRLQRRR